eukprot:gene19037-19387_t
MQQYGEDVVNAFKIGYKGRPPPMQPEHPYWHANERKYADLDPSKIPLTESLEDCMIRAKVLFDEKMKADIEMGKNVLVVAHANSLRGLIKNLEQLGDDEISDVTIPNGIPLVYEFDSNMKIIPRAGAIPPLRGEYLEKRGLFKAVLQREKELSSAAAAAAAATAAAASTSQSLYLLEADNVKESETTPPAQQPLSNHQNPSQVLFNTVEYGIATNLGSDLPLPEKKRDLESLKARPQYLGRAEARKAGEVLKLHGIELDVVYTSWLSRAIETAWIVLNELDSMWLPIVKTWRLNERMDCMSRTIPFYTNTIVPQSIAKGDNVLICSSENALRGLLMHLMDIPPDRIQDVQSFKINLELESNIIFKHDEIFATQSYWIFVVYDSVESINIYALVVDNFLGVEMG